MTESKDPRPNANIVLIDNNSDNLALLKRYLSNAGYNVVIAANGKDGLEKINDSLPDLVIANINMPEINGFEFIQSIRSSEQLRHLPILFMSAAYTDLAKKVNSIEIGKNDYLSEPIDKNEFLFKVKSLLRTSKLNDDLNEQAKELNCLYESLLFMSNADASIEQTLEKIVHLIPAAWQYPEITCTKITHNDFSVTTDNFSETAWIQFAHIIVFGKTSGSIEIYYLKKRPSLFEGPFTKGEQRLINGLSKEVGLYIERKMYEAQLKQATIIDDLTGLYNRSGFFALAEQQCQHADLNNSTLPMVCLGLDNMKMINGSFSHMAGDQAIRDTADILKATFSKLDIIARMGGDKFAVLLTGPSPEQDNVIARNLVNCISSHNTNKAKAYDISLSIGFAHYEPENSLSIGDLLTKADTMMHKHRKSKTVSRQSEGVEQAIDKRYHRRYDVGSSYTAEVDGTEKVMVRNLSLGGICIKSQTPLTIDNSYSVKLVSPDSTEVISKCTAVWSLPLTDENTETPPAYETGLQFNKTNDHLKKSLHKIIEQAEI